MVNRVLLLFLTIRVASVFLVQTWFIPDEYWQSLEVAHRLAFGYGHLTWEWTAGIRSYIYPALIAAVYKLLALLDLDTVDLIVLLPRILQALLSSYSDYRFYVWSKKSKWSVFMLATSWFWFYTGSRTLANTLETSLTVIALSYFPWSASENANFLWPVALSAFIRPTSVIPWVPLCLYHVRKSAHPLWEVVLKRYVLIGVLVGALTVGIDTFFHGSPLVSAYEFARYNVFQGIGSFYGENPWYWYIFIGLPTIMGITTVPFLLAAVETVRHSKVYVERAVLLQSIAFTLVVYSFLPHKEFRFILPILPLGLYICADYLGRWSRKASGKFVWFAAVTLLVSNVVPAVYFGWIHQRGTLDVMKGLQNVASSYRDEYNNPAKVLFLMPCHSTPYYSHVHQNTTMRFLRCEPNFDGREDYVDEADNFYRNPMDWIRRNLPVHPRTALPTHIVAFDVLAPQIDEFLQKYSLKSEWFHSDYATDRVGSTVRLYERVNPSASQTAPPPSTPPPAPKQQEQLDEDETA